MEFKNLKDNQINNNYKNLHSKIYYLRVLYLLLSIQFLFITFISYLAVEYKEFSKGLASNQFVIYISLFSMFLILLFYIFFRPIGNSLPYNLVFYTLYSILFAFAGAYICSKINNHQLGFYIFGGFLSIFFALFISTLLTKKELSLRGSSLFVFGAIFIIYEIFLIFSNVKFLNLVWASFTLAVFAFLIIYSTQTDVTRIKSEWTIHNAIGSTISIYLDIILIIIRASELIFQLMFKNKF